MKHVICFLLLTLPLMLVPSAPAQDKPPASVAAATAPAPKVVEPILANKDSQLAIFKAEHDLDQAKHNVDEITNQFNQLQRQADMLTPRYKEEQDKQKKAQTAVDAAVDAVWKANALSKDEYNFDPANMTFAEKPKPPKTEAKATPPVTNATGDVKK